MNLQTVPLHALEEHFDVMTAVRVRRKAIKEIAPSGSLDGLPFDDDSCKSQKLYQSVRGACCENVIGFVRIPVGIAGPLRVDGQEVLVPMATTEGALIASTSRGCKVLREAGGVSTSVIVRGMARAPLVELPTPAEAREFSKWAESTEGSAAFSAALAETSSHARFVSARATVVGRMVFVRISADTGDAMGMNIISRACEAALNGESCEARKRFPGLRVVAISGNLCSDKKAAAVNAIEGRGRSVTAEAVIPGEVLKRVLGTDAETLEKVCTRKCWLGSGIAGAAPGGLNAQAANVVAAIFLATGQDCAQVVESSNCITSMERMPGGASLVASCTMPSVEVGTVGGGTRLDDQKACLSILGVSGPSPPGRPNSSRLAGIICATVLAAEISLLGALSKGQLVSAHMKPNRKK